MTPGSFGSFGKTVLKCFLNPADNRDLNYAKYFKEGADISMLDDYKSQNTKRLNVKEVKSLLLTLDYIKDELHA